MTDVPPGPERERRFAQSGGNPLLLRELLRAAPDGVVPGGIVAAVAAEVDALPAAARSLVQAAAIVGDPFELDLAASIAELDEGAALTALDALEEGELVRPTGEPREFTFRHPVVRTAVYEELGAGARIALHAAAARALARRHAPRAAQARHLVHCAGAGDGAVAETLSAAAADVRAQAPDVAADWMLAARRASPARVDVGVLAETLVEAGRLTEALDVVRAAAQDAPAGTLVPLAVAGAGLERLLGLHDAAQARLLEALETTVPGSPDGDRVRADLAVCAYLRGDYADMGGWARQVGHAGASGGAVRAVAATLLAVGAAFDGDAAAVEVGVDRALAAIADAGDEDLGAAAELAVSVSWGLLALDRLSDGLRVAQRIEAAARRCGNGSAAMPHALAAVLALGLLGRIAEAEQAADDAEQAARVGGNPQLTQMALWMQAWVLLERGRLDPALAAAQRERGARRRPRRLGVRGRRAARCWGRCSERAVITRAPASCSRPTTSTAAGSAAGRRSS